MDIKLDENNDRAAVDEVVTDDEELAQAIKITLATNLGELEWNRKFGLSHQDILDNADSRDYIVKQVEDCLAANFDEFENVNIVSINPHITNRQLNVVLEVKMANGETIQVDTGSNDETEV